MEDGDGGEVGENVEGENCPEEEEMGDRSSIVGGADLMELGVFSLVWKLSDSLSLLNPLAPLTLLTPLTPLTLLTLLTPLTLLMPLTLLRLLTLLLLKEFVEAEDLMPMKEEEDLRMIF